MLLKAFEDSEWNSLFESEDETEDEENVIEEPEEEVDDESSPEVDPVEEDENESDSDDILSEISAKVKLTKAEIEIVDSLIESEVDAVADYSKALNETKNKFARKLYTEIISDESKHLSQLKYLKSMGTDSDYVPKDKEANDELAEILESLIEEL